MINIAIIGSRGLSDYNTFLNKMKEIELPTEEIRIVSGGAKGVDTLAERYADEMNYDKLIIKPEWSRYGKGAGIIRNKEIIKNADMIIAFWDGISPGTKHSIERAKKLDKRIVIVLV